MNEARGVREPMAERWGLPASYLARAQEKGLRQIRRVLLILKSSVAWSYPNPDLGFAKCTALPRQLN